MRASSTDLKERLVRAVATGLPMREAARRFDVAVTTVKRAVVRQRETGSLERKPIPGPRVVHRRSAMTKKRSCGRGWKRHRMRRCWSTAPGGRSTRASR
jgi:transposase